MSDNEEFIFSPTPNWLNKIEEVEEITQLRMEEIRKSEERLDKIAEFGPDLRIEVIQPIRKVTITPHNKYSDEIRQNIVRDVRAGHMQKDIARKHNVSGPTVSRIYLEYLRSRQ